MPSGWRLRCSRIAVYRYVQHFHRSGIDSCCSLPRYICLRMEQTNDTHTFAVLVVPEEQPVVSDPVVQVVHRLGVSRFVGATVPPGWMYRQPESFVIPSTQLTTRHQDKSSLAQTPARIWPVHETMVNPRVLQAASLC